MRHHSTRLLATLALAVVACAGPGGESTPVGAGPLRFIEDDWSAAVSEARSRRVPLFVEAWAPW